MVKNGNKSNKIDFAFCEWMVFVDTKPKNMAKRVFLSGKTKKKQVFCRKNTKNLNKK